VNADPRRLRLLLAALVAVATLLVAVDLRGGGSPSDALRTGASAVLGPPLRVAGGTVSALGDAARGLTGADAREAERLRAEVDRLAREVAQRDAQAAREAQLGALYGLTALGQYRTLAARVIAYGEGLVGSAWTVTLDAGADAGVRPDMTVVSGNGLVGRVTRVSPTTSQVLLAVDPSSSVGARLEGAAASTTPGRLGEVGLVEGGGDGDLVLRLLDAQARVEVGQRVVTFGSTYVPGVPVGEVVEVQSAPGSLERRARVRPAVDPSALDVVGVVVEAAAGDPGDAVLPPRPGAVPTPVAGPGSAAPGPRAAG
jgi:rod shape-determining protein MreC